MRIFLTFIIAILLLPLALAASGQSNPDIQVSIFSQSPDPVEPGQVMKVKFKIENDGDETDKDVIVKLHPKFPFSIYGDVIEKNLGKLPAGSTGADAKIVTFQIKVDEEATEGETELELEVINGPSGVLYNDDEFLINIETHDAVLDITSITTEPSQIPPGEVAQVTIMVKNLADSLLKDIKLKLDLNDDDLPLAPHQSSSERILANLDSGLQNSLTFTLKAAPDATPGLYKVPMNISYNDERGNANVIQDVLAVTLGDTPNVKPFIKKSTVLQAEKEGKMTLGIANAGTTDVKFVELFLLASDDYTLISTSDYVYIGDVDSDDTESQEFDIFVEEDVNILHVPVKLKYLDANNRAFQQQFDLELTLYSSSDLRKFGLIETSNTGIYVLVLVLLALGYWRYRKTGKIPLRRFATKIVKKAQHSKK